MRYTLRQLEVFLAIAHFENVSHAANHLSMSQSAASGALKELEGLYDVKFFERAGKRLKLNELGRQFWPRAEALLAQATVTLVNAAGEEAVDKNGKLVLHTGTPVIHTDSTSECSITWPEMGVLDTSRTVHGVPAKQLKVSAKECGGNRGAIGWFSLKVSVPGCNDLWLRNPTTGQRAKIIVKNERNAALSWAEKAEGPYADHSRCVPSHIDEHGHRLCQHGCGSGKKMLCRRSRTKIKMEAAD